MTTAREYTSRLADLLRREHQAMADFLVALSDFDARRLWVELGYRSLFDFLHRELGLSKGAAHYRKTAAELLQRCPDVVEPLRDGRLCFTSIVELAKVLTPENLVEVLPRFFHRSKREAMAEVAALLPAEAPPRRDVVTALRAAPAPAPRAEVPLAVAAQPHTDAATIPVPPPPRVHPVELPGANSSRATQESRETSIPLTAELCRLHITVSKHFLEKVEAVRAAISHARPGASTEQILEAGLELLLTQHAKRKGVVARPQEKPRSSKPGHIPARARRAVWARDEGRCQHPLDGGGVCGSTHQVEFHHLDPAAKGGPASVENLSLRCRFHNDVAARQDFGKAWIDRFTGSKSPVAAKPAERKPATASSP